MVLFQCSQKLSSYLVRAKVYPTGRKVESCCCGKKQCHVCLKVTETDSFTRTSTNDTYSSKNIVICLIVMKNV